MFCDLSIAFIAEARLTVLLSSWVVLSSAGVFTAETRRWFHGYVCLSSYTVRVPSVVSACVKFSMFQLLDSICLNWLLVKDMFGAQLYGSFHITY